MLMHSDLHYSSVSCQLVIRLLAVEGGSPTLE